MREQLAKALTALTGVLIVVAALAFGAIQNRPDAARLAPVDAERLAAGKAVYEAQGCALCHAIAGEGDPAYPLDGIGARMNEAQLRAHIAPAADLAAGFPEVVFEMKQAYHTMSPEDMGALVDYLRNLK